MQCIFLRAVWSSDLPLGGERDWKKTYHSGVKRNLRSVQTCVSWSALTAEGGCCGKGGSEVDSGSASLASPTACQHSPPKPRLSNEKDGRNWSPQENDPRAPSLSAMNLDLHVVTDRGPSVAYLVGESEVRNRGHRRRLRESRRPRQSAVWRLPLLPLPVNVQGR